MKPVNITNEDTFEDLRDKLIDFMDDYEKLKTVINDNVYDLVADEVISHEIPGDAVALDTTAISDPPTQAEVQAVQTKVNQTLAQLINSLKISSGG